MRQATPNRIVNLFPTKAIPAPPDWGAKKKRLWREIVGAFDAGYFRSSDRRTLAAYIEAIDLHDRMTDVIDREGAILTDANGRRYANPACGIQNQAATRIASLGTKLRIHASARMRSEDAFAAARKAPSSFQGPWELERGKSREATDRESIESKYFD